MEPDDSFFSTGWELARHLQAIKQDNNEHYQSCFSNFTGAVSRDKPELLKKEHYLISKLSHYLKHAQRLGKRHISRAVHSTLIQCNLDSWADSQRARKFKTVLIIFNSTYNRLKTCNVMLYLTYKEEHFIVI